MNENKKSRNQIDIITSVLVYLFIYSGLIKWIYSPVDLTLILGFLVASAILFRLFFFKPVVSLIEKKIAVFFFLLHFLAFASITYTQSTNYYIFKLLKISLNIGVFLLVFFAFIRKENLNTFLKVCYFFWVLSLVVLSWQYIDNKLEIIRAVNNNDEYEYVTYVAVSYYLGLNIFLFINRMRSVSGLLFSALSLGFMIILAGKGPLLILALLMFVYFVFGKFQSGKKKLRNLVFYSIFLTSVVLLIGRMDVFSLLIQRVNPDDVGVIQSESVLIRATLLNNAIGLITSNPIFGVGIGGQGIALNGQDIRSSSHNFIFEIAVELGFLGLLVFFLLLFFYRKYIHMAMRSVQVKSQYLETKAIYYVVIYLFMESMIDSFWEDSRILYFWFAFSLIQTRLTSIWKKDKLIIRTL